MFETWHIRFYVLTIGWVLPSLNVWPHSLPKYKIFQVGLAIQLAIFISKYKYKDTDVRNLTYLVLCFGNRLMKNEFCKAITLELMPLKNIYKIPSWTDAPFSNIPIQVQIQRHRRLKLDICGFMFWQSALEERVLPSLNVWPHSLRKYTIFQVGLMIQLAIFLSKYKYKDTDVKNLTYLVLCFGNRLMTNEFCQVITLELIPKDIYMKIQVGLTLQLAIFPFKFKYKDTNVWNLAYWFLCFGNRLLKNGFCQALMFDLIVYENIQYFKLDWRSN